METLMIFAAGAAIIFVLAMVYAMSRRAQRSPLRTGRDDDLAEAVENPLTFIPRRKGVSPIDRATPIHDLDPIDAKMIGTMRTEGPRDAGRGIERVEEADWWEIEDDEPERSTDRTGREQR